VAQIITTSRRHLM